MSPVRWRIKRSLRGRRGHLANELGCSIFMIVMFAGMIVVMVGVLLFTPDLDGEVIVAAIFWIVASILMIAGGVAMAREPMRELRRREDRVWLDETELRWTQHRPRLRGVEPDRVDRSEIVQVRLDSGDDWVVVTTTDGAEHPVTSLGTLAERAALAREIGARLGPATARVHPTTPPDLPHAWVARPGPDGGTTLAWRLPNPARPWGVLGLGYPLVLVCAIAPAHWSGWRLALLVPPIGLAAAGLIYWFRHELRLTRTAWLVRAGRLDAVRIHARTGNSPVDPAQVHALELERGRWPGQRRLHAVLAEERRLVASGWRHIGDLARWLTDRADLTLVELPTRAGPRSVAVGGRRPPSVGTLRARGNWIDP
jgi:hypothetical protein